MGLSKKEQFERKVLEERVKAAEAQANIFKGRLQYAEMDFKPIVQNISIQQIKIIDDLIKACNELNRKVSLIASCLPAPKKRWFW